MYPATLFNWNTFIALKQARHLLGMHLQFLITTTMQQSPRYTK